MAPRSPDIIPYDFFLWGYLNSKVYVGGGPDLITFKNNIAQTVANITEDMLCSSVENVVQRMQCVIHQNGDHIESDRCKIVK